LLGTAFLELLPEAIILTGTSEKSLMEIFLYLISGFCAFFILEQFLSWHHHHSMSHPEIKSFSLLILISDAIHNLIDGLIVAGSFVVSVPLGIATSLAIIFHEIPHELGNFGVLIFGGFKKTKALLLNFASAFFAVLGGIIGYLLSERIGEKFVFLLPFAAGSFIYIAASDLIPQIKEETNIRKSGSYFFVFLTGIIIMALIKLYVE
jgi:zinc and cadmium transporter